MKVYVQLDVVGDVDRDVDGDINVVVHDDDHVSDAATWYT